MTQKDAVFSAVASVLVGSGINFISGSTDANDLLNKDLRSKVNSILIQQFLNNEIELSAEAKTRLADLSKLKAYVSGLVSNWLRKDNRLNAGVAPMKVKSVVKRTSADPQLKAMRHLLTVQTDPNKRNEIQSFIDKRVQELNQ